MKRKTPKVGWCPQCGPLTAGALDEDGCCALCGADATGPGADKALRLLKRADPAKERALRAAAIRALAQTPPSGRYVPDEVLEKAEKFIEDDTCRHDYEKREVLAALAEVKP